MKTIYQACDGETFEDRAEAVEHETELFESWLKDLIVGNNQTRLSEVVRHFNDSPDLPCEKDVYHGTSWDILKVSLREYWDDTMSERSN